jgi:hypothetical protein
VIPVDEGYCRFFSEKYTLYWIFHNIILAKRVAKIISGKPLESNAISSVMEVIQRIKSHVV